MISAVFLSFYDETYITYMSRPGGLVLTLWHSSLFV